MALIAIDQLLAPLPGTDPCGEDPANDPLSLRLDSILRTEEDEENSPDWNELHKTCLELFRKGKDLRVAVALALAGLQVGGLAAFADELLVIHGLLAQYWDGVYPRLDPEFGNDPDERIGTLAALYLPAGTDRDPWKFQERLRRTPLVEARGTGYNARDLARAQEGPAGEAADLEAALRYVSLAEAGACRETIAAAIETVRKIEQVLREKVGSRFESWTPLLETLAELDHRVAPYGSPGAAPGAAGEAAPSMAPREPGSAPSAAPASPAGAVASSGVQSRADVIRVLSTICDYYARAEPSSPIPLLLRRAQRLVDKDFLTIMEDLAPEGLAGAKRLAGLKTESSGDESSG